MLPLINKEGITIRQLKELVKDLKETDENGEDYGLWISNTNNSGQSNPARSIFSLNKGDIIIGIEV